VIGQVTGTKTKVLDGNIGTARSGGYTWLKNITYYDDKYRAIQIIADNYKGGTDRVTNVYDFTGKVLESQSTHTEADLTWTSPVSIVASGNALRSTATTSGAASIQQLAAGQNGWIEAIYSEGTTTRFFGWNDANPDVASANINYAFRFTTSSTVNVVENGTTKATITGVAAGDVFRITRTGTAVTYTRNGNPITLSPASTASSTLLMADLSLTTNNATLVGLRSSFSTTTQITTRRFEYDHAGRLLNTWHKLNGGPDILLVKNEYNELGQLVDKKLHSTVSTGADAKQSVDYRYNIRGWLTHINNAQVNTQPATNDDTNDLFGMELFYNQTDANLSNTALYNGNISATKWSSPMGLGTVKEKGYTYSYDELNRIKTSVFKEKATAWSTPANSGFQETGFNYDLNGNITTLQRNDKRATGWMDNLAYTYTGNQLMRVTDTGDDFAGFMDGQPGTGNDYTYDVNGNMTRDLNKGIGTSLSDATNIIAYNFLNLPETVTKGTNSIRYIYDATGRKLAQTTTFGTRVKTTDYAGEFVYEDDNLQFINHEEGRIAIAANKTIVTHDGATTDGITAVTSTLAPVTQNSNQKYIRATAVGTTTKQGMFPIGGTLTVAAGEQYRIRAKGYRTATTANNVHLYIRTNSTDLNWPGAQFPRGTASATNESYVEQIITIPAGHTTLQAGVVWNTVAAGEQFFLNDFEITKLTTHATPEYQYHLKDHLGNTRLTFTSKEEIESATATLETAAANTEQSNFLRYTNAKRINSTLFDRTNGAATGHAQRLNGSANEKYGLARSLSVMPGDKINIEVYAKYVDPNSTNWTGVLPTLMSQIASSTAGVVIDGAGYGTSTSTFPFPTQATANTSGSSEPGPKAYLNWLVFDKNYVLLTGGFDRLSTGAREFGQDVAHERLFSPEVLITEPGFVYIFLSNEETTPMEVYFDDFKVDHIKSPIVQSDDYYAFGLTFNSYNRENSVANQYLYNGKEKQDELGLDWFDYGFRYYDPAIARWMVVDPLADKFTSWSPYNYVANNPVMLTDRDGAAPEPPEWLKGVINFFKNLVSPVDNAEQAIQREEHRAAFNRFAEKVNDLRDAQRTGIDFLPGGAVFNAIIDGNTNQRSNGELATDVGVSAAIGMVVPVGAGGIKNLIKGAGKEILEGVVKKVDNIAGHLTDKDVTGAVRDVLGNPVVINGKTFDHLGEVKDALKGLGKQIDKLTKNIDKGKLTDEVKDEAVRIRSSLQKEKDRIQNILNKAENYVKENN
jgi:RHS repeat-associated protein